MPDFEVGKTEELSRIPLHLLTGFLGSGKTTLLNRVLRAPGMDGTLVIVNEFGDVGLDHLLIEAPADETILLANGCLCCTVIGDLLVTLTRLILRLDAGEVQRFPRVVIETTGLSDPAPILRTILGDALVSSRFELRGVLTVVDGCNGISTIETHAEALKQVVVADRLVVSKNDLSTAAAIDAVATKLRSLNAGAEVFKAGIRDDELTSLFSTVGAKRNWRSWLAGGGNVFASSNSSHLGYGDAVVKTFTLHHAAPISAEALRLWLNAISRFAGPALLRMKGLLNVEGMPVVVQAVQDVVHEPMTLDAWPSEDRGSRIVFITERLERSDIESTLSAFDYTRPAGQAGQLGFDNGDYARFLSAVRNFASMERV